MDANVYLVCGATGAGKSTYSKKLAADIGGVHFAIDDWMATLFWMDSPDPIEFEWTLARIARCEAQIWAQVLALTARGVPAILDLGFTKTDHRKKFTDLAAKAGLQTSLCLVDVPSDIRWQRVQNRNLEKGDTYALDVTRDMFDFMEGEWEMPDGAEMKRLNGARV